MATLPDLATTTISTLAYFDTGAAIKKSDLLPLLESFTEYDNGFDGILSFTVDGTRTSTGNRVQVRVRARTDGLVYAWGLRADEIKDGTAKDSATAGVVGWQRALLPISGLGNLAPAASDTMLYRAISTLVAADTTAGKTVPTAATVSYYDFEFTSTGNIYVFGSGTGPSNSSLTSSFQFTQPAGVTIYVFGYHWNYLEGSSGTGSGSGSMTVNGTTVVSKGGIGIGVGGVMWSSRQGASITSLLQAQGTQNNAATTQGSTGGTSSFSGFGVLVIYASS